LTVAARRAERGSSAPVIQTSIISAISRASPTSMPGEYVYNGSVANKALELSAIVLG